MYYSIRLKIQQILNRTTFCVGIAGLRFMFWQPLSADHFVFEASGSSPVAQFVFESSPGLHVSSPVTLAPPRQNVRRSSVVKDSSAPVFVTQAYEKPSKKYQRPTQFSLADFPVAGVNLAAYGINETVQVDPLVRPFELFDDFDISELIQGDEGWWDLIDYRRHLKRPTISFYGDKVAQKRWMQAMGFPFPKLHVLQYRSELTETGGAVEEKAAIEKVIPRRTDYVAKPTHRSSASGVWVVKYDESSGTNSVAYGGGKLDDVYDKSEVVNSLVKDIHRPANDDESWALRKVEPGLMIEERYTDFMTDGLAATEFKVFLIWGRVWIVNWKNGHYRSGLVHRNGTLVECADKHEDKLPEWIDWDKIVKLAEDLAVHKDLFRVDIFAGVPAESPSLRQEATKEEKTAAVQYVVNEQAFLPTTSFNEKKIFDEGARLWIAGYKMGNYKVVPNNEVPAAYKKTHMLSEKDTEMIRLQRHLGGSSSSMLISSSL